MNQIGKEICEMIEELMEDTNGLEGKMDAGLLDELDFDSVQILDLINTIEEKFHIEFVDLSELLDRIDSVNDFICYVEKIVLQSCGNGVSI